MFIMRVDWMVNMGLKEDDISIVIPVLNAESDLPDLFDMIGRQEGVNIREILLVDSMSTDATREIAEEYDGVGVIPIENFSHGRARNLGVNIAGGKYVVFMTQDALPADVNWLSELIAPLENERVAASFSRQVPRENANPMERYFLQTHFSDEQQVFMKKDKDREMDFQRDVFLSNVSAAARRDILLQFPLDEDLIMSEDQQFAHDVLEAGYAVVYQPYSMVIHSHNYSLKKVFQRYFDSVYSVRKIFKSHTAQKSVAMGSKYLLKESVFIVSHHPLWIPYYVFYTAARVLGTLMSHFADVMPRRFAARMSFYNYYWK